MTEQAQIDWKTKMLEAVPLLVGFLITRQFKLHGWRSILVYGLAAGITRQLMEVLETEINHGALLSDASSTLATTNGKDPPSTSNVKTVLESPPHYQVIHSTPGRMRIRLPSVDPNIPIQPLLQQLSDDVPVQSIRFNPHSSSLTIRYDIHTQPESKLDSIIREWFKSAFQASVEP